MPHYMSPDKALHFIDDAKFANILPVGSVPINLPPKPDDTYIWSGAAWVQDATLVASVEESVRLQTERSTVAQVPAIKALIAMTPAQIDAWILANVIDLPTARNALGILAKIIAVVARGDVK